MISKRVQRSSGHARCFDHWADQSELPCSGKAVLAEVLTDLGHQVEVREAPHEEMFRMQRNGEVDLLCSAWLPASHQVYLDPYKSDVLRLGVVYTPYCLWGIPEDASDEVRSVQDLANPNITKLFRKGIQGINPDAGISRFSRQMVDD